MNRRPSTSMALEVDRCHPGGRPPCHGSDEGTRMSETPHGPSIDEDVHARRPHGGTIPAVATGFGAGVPQAPRMRENFAL
jgi:hypothetical protein